MIRHIFVLGTLLLLLNRCSDNATDPSSNADEFFEAKVNGARWVGELNASLPSTPGFPPMPSFVMKRFEAGVLTLMIPRKQELFSDPELMSISARRFEESGNFETRIVMLSRRSKFFQLDSAMAFNITRIDTTQKIIEGAFAFRLREIIFPPPDPFNTAFGDSVIMVTDGRFRIKYETETRWTTP